MPQGGSGGGRGAAGPPTPRPTRRSLPFTAQGTTVASPSTSPGARRRYADLHGAGVLHEHGVESARAAARESDGGAPAGDREARGEAARLVLLLGRLRRRGSLRRAR